MNNFNFSIYDLKFLFYFLNHEPFLYVTIYVKIVHMKRNPT